MDVAANPTDIFTTRGVGYRMPEPERGGGVSAHVPPEGDPALDWVPCRVLASDDGKEPGPLVDSTVIPRPPEAVSWQVTRGSRGGT